MDFVGVLRSRWRWVVLSVISCVAAAVAGTAATTPQYAASVQLFVSTNGSADTANALQNNQFSSQRVSSYSELIKGIQVAQRVVGQLGLQTSAAAVASQVTVSVVPDTVILNVTVTDPSGTRARDIANALSTQFTGLVTQLETPTGGAVAAAKVTVVQQAEVPASPVSPSPTRNVGLGLAIGILLGIAVAVLRDRLDNTVKVRRDIVEHTGAAVIGVLPFDAERRTRPLISLGEGHSTSAESYRQLRTNLQFLDVDQPPRVLVITSAVPSEGKTTMACNLAFVLAEAGHTVLLVEADMRRSRVARYLNLVENVGITNILAGTANLDDVLQTTRSANVTVLGSGPHPPNPSELLGSAQMQQLISLTRSRYDYVVIDAPPLLPVTDAAVLTTLADGAILVARHGHTKREDLARAAENLRAVDARILGTVLNMVPSKSGAYEYAYYYETEANPAATSAAVAAAGPAPSGRGGRGGRRHQRDSAEGIIPTPARLSFTDTEDDLDVPRDDNERSGPRR